jgi:signal transduction histidine kinase
LAQVGTLAAGVAHEINNPLGAVLANLTFAQDAAAGDGTISPEQMREALDEARIAAERVREIVRDLTMLARFEEGPAGCADLSKVIESTLRIAGNEIRHRARLTTELATVPRVRGSEARLGQVLLNLAVNAMHAIPEGRQDAEIRVVTRVDAPGMVAVDVSDTGHGMSEEVQHRLFTPFFTTKPMGQGTGLGLSICERIVTSLGGHIRVRSAVGVGSTFTVVLPVAEVAAKTSAAPAVAPDAQPDGTYLGHRRRAHRGASDRTGPCTVTKYTPPAAPRRRSSCSSSTRLRRFCAISRCRVTGVDF